MGLDSVWAKCSLGTPGLKHFVCFIWSRNFYHKKESENGQTESCLQQCSRGLTGCERASEVHQRGSIWALVVSVKSRATLSHSLRMARPCPVVVGALGLEEFVPGKLAAFRYTSSLMVLGLGIRHCCSRVWINASSRNHSLSLDSKLVKVRIYQYLPNKDNRFILKKNYRTSFLIKQKDLMDC